MHEMGHGPLSNCNFNRTSKKHHTANPSTRNFIRRDNEKKKNQNQKKYFCGGRGGKDIVSEWLVVGLGRRKSPFLPVLSFGFLIPNTNAWQVDTKSSTCTFAHSWWTVLAKCSSCSRSHRRDGSSWLAKPRS